MPVTAYDTYSHEISYKIPGNIPSRYLAGGVPILTAYGCALVERQTAKSYIYTTVNIESGKSETLSRRTKPLEQSVHSGMAAKIRTSSVCGAARLNTDVAPGQHLNHMELAEILNTVFTEILPEYGYAFRENQVALAEHILETISRRGITLAESEVGTGKTLAYLTAAALAKRGRLNDFWLRGAHTHHKVMLIAPGSQ